jgi:choline dehydrogenase-like flavoprotein
MIAEPARSVSLTRLAGAVTSPQGDEEAAQLERELQLVLAGVPRWGRVALALGATALHAGASLSTRRRPSAVAPEQLAALLEQASAVHPLAPVATALKSLVALAAGARLAGATLETHGVARPDPTLDVVDADQWPQRYLADAVVIGSGAGGAMAARTLARAGAAVVVVEEGERFGLEDFRSLAPAQRLAALYRDGGATGALGRPSILVPQGRGVGGSTLINSGTCFRPPEKVLQRWWREARFAPSAPQVLEPYVEEVWRTLRVAPTPAHVLGRNAELALLGAAVLGWSAAPLQRNAPGCGGCCQCAIGCPRNAKYGVHLNALPEACAAGARIVARARVERILTRDGRATAVLARRRDGSQLRIDAPLLMVAAGAVQTPTLLRRSGLGTHPELGRNLSLHPALTVAGRFAEPVVGWRGVLQSAGVDSFHQGEGILLEATSAPPGLASLSLPGVGAAFRRELEQAGHLATVGAMIADAPGGRVHGRRRPLMTYRLSRADGRRLLRAVELAGQLLFAAGAREVLPGLAGRAHVGSVRELQEAVIGADPRELHLAAFHPSGSARAGADATRHPVDEYGRLRGVEGVWVCDASVLPSCPTVNPQVSIMAVALHIADAALREARGLRRPSANISCAESRRSSRAGAAAAV